MTPDVRKVYLAKERSEMGEFEVVWASGKVVRVRQHFLLLNLMRQKRRDIMWLSDFLL